MRGIVLPHNLGPLAKLCGDHGQYNRFADSGVHVQDLNGAYRLEATDCRSLAVVRGEFDTQGHEGPSKVRDFVVPGKEWLETLGFFKRATGKNANGVQAPVILGAQGDRYQMWCLGASREGPLLEGRYPPVNEALPKGPPLATVRVNQKYLAGLMDLATALGLEWVDLMVYGPPGKLVPVGVCGHNGDGQYLDAILMPIERPAPQVRRDPTGPGADDGQDDMENGEEIPDNGEPPPPVNGVAH